MALVSIDRDTVERIKDFFFDGMLAGYLGNAKREDVPDMPCYRRIMWEHGDFMLADLYMKTLGTHGSNGQVTIWFRNEPVWMMSYHGRYDRKGLPVLKAALRQQYERRDFHGGRGPRSFLLGPYTYTNTVERWHFERFNGFERIEDRSTLSDPHATSPLSLGSHQYLGGLLVDVR